MEWASRFVLSWELDNTMAVGFCVSAMEEALRRHDAPAISAVGIASLLQRAAGGGEGHQSSNVAAGIDFPYIRDLARLMSTLEDAG